MSFKQYNYFKTRGPTNVNKSCTSFMKAPAKNLPEKIFIKHQPKEGILYGFLNSILSYYS